MGKSGPTATCNLNLSWVGLALGWGVRRFHNNIYMFSSQRNLVPGISQDTQSSIVIFIAFTRYMFSNTTASVSSSNRDSSGMMRRYDETRQTGPMTSPSPTTPRLKRKVCHVLTSHVERTVRLHDQCLRGMEHLPLRYGYSCGLSIGYCYGLMVVGFVT